MRRRSGWGGVATPSCLLLLLVAGCATNQSQIPLEPEGWTPRLPDGIALDGATITDVNATSISLRWTGNTDDKMTVGAQPRFFDETILTLPAGVAFDVVSERLPVAATETAPTFTEELQTELIDAEGWIRCSGRGPGLGTEWREVCRVRPAGPFSEASQWILRVSRIAQAGNEDPFLPFALDVTVRALAPATFGALGEVKAFEATAEDGVQLRGHLYLPAGPGPFATILVFQPYWNHGGAVNSDELERPYDGRRTLVRPWGTFLDAGFALAAVNSRGTGLSDGCYEYMNHPRNGPDANSVIDAIASEPWSNGKVGMYGVSYPGATQFAAIAHDPSPHLAAVMPLSGEWDEWNFLAIWGASYLGAESHPTRRNFEQGMGGGGILAAAPQGQIELPTPTHWCQDTVMSQPNWNQLILSGDKNSWFRARDLRGGIRESPVPIFVGNGMTDMESGHRSTPYDLWDLVEAPQRWLLGQYPHGPPGRDYIGFNWDYAIPWFDHYLRDGPAVEIGVVEFQDDAGEWHRADHWPPRGATKELFLSDGTLVADAASVRSSQQRIVNRDAVVAAPGQCETTAMFVSEPFPEETVLAGEFRMNFTVASNAPNGNVAAYVYATRAVPGCGASPSDARLLRYALSDLRHRGHLEQGIDVGPGQALTMSMRSYPFASHVDEGERLVLVIASGHPDLTPKPFQPVLTVTTGSNVEGRLSFTSVPIGS